MGKALLLLGLTLLSCVEVIAQSYSALLASATQVCQVEVMLHDSDEDGWNGNTFQLKAGPTTTDYAVPLSPMNQLCATYLDSSGAPTIGTLLDSTYCSFAVQIPAGWNVAMNFFWTFAAWPNENSIAAQLSYVEPFFGPVSVFASKFHNLTDASGHTTPVPYIDPVFSLVCGPVPTQVASVSAAPNTVGTGSLLAETIISWSPVIVTGAQIAFEVTVQDLTSGDPELRLGVYTGSTATVLLTENTNYLLSVTAINQYGEAQAATTSYLTHNYVTAEVGVVLFSTYPYAWFPDGGVAILVNSAMAGIVTITDDSPKTVFYLPYVADGTPQIFSVHYFPPTGSAGATSFLLNRREGGSELFNSGLTVNGPVYYDATFSVSHPAPAKTCGVCCFGPGKCPDADPVGYCCDAGLICCKTGTGSAPYTCCSGAQKCVSNFTGTLPAPKTCAVPTAVCPTSPPNNGDLCYGSLSCTYNSSCCCPNDDDAVCGATVKFECTGQSGATWIQSNLSLPCQTDPNFLCPRDCPDEAPSSDQMCVGAQTCFYGKTCCCPNEPQPEDQICTMQTQVQCSGGVGGYWQTTSVIPAPCPSLCPSQTKPGTCPTITGTCAGTSVQQCRFDGQCPGTMLCCGGPCGNTCIQPCSCSATPTCLPWEKVQFTPDPTVCCGGNQTCVTDPTSTQCPTQTPSFDSLQCVLMANQTCGNGLKTRTVNTRLPTGCNTTTQTQSCSVPCPVDCVGSWSSCGTCSSSCRGGTCTQTYHITVQPANGGKPCNYSDGALSTPQACNSNIPCPLYCPIFIVVKDWYGDGWTYSTPKGFVNFYNNATGQLILSQWISSAKINTTALNLLSGTVLKIVYTPDKYYYEDIIMITQNLNGVQGTIIYQDPMDLSKWGVKGGPAPHNISYFTVKCNDCSALPPNYCLNVENRQPCTIYSSGSAAGCGACAPGWALGANLTGHCVDINECATSPNLCSMASANCTNVPGSFTCQCPPGSRWSFGYCETPGVCPPQRFRMEWFDMSPKQRQLYHNAYQCLYNTGMYQSLWTYHSSIPQFGINYPSPFHYGHDHGSGFFYWHRVFGLRFEDMVRQCAKLQNITELQCFVGAYWDSPSMLLAANTDPDRIAYMRQTFWTDSRDSNGNALGMGQRTDQYDATMPFNYIAGGLPNYFARGPDSPNSTLWPATDIQWGIIASAQQMSDLTQLVGPHFAMHPFVGGVFGGVTSAQDPFFFLHHFYYDQMWEVWKLCNNKTSWANASYAQRWYANNPSQDYNPDGPMQGFMAYPQDVYDAQNIVLRNPDGTVSGTTAIVYSSSSVTRASGAGLISCPNVVGKYFKASINDSMVTNALQMPVKNPAALAEKRSFLKSGGVLGPRVRRHVPVYVPPPNLWHGGTREFHSEALSPWRMHVRRLAGVGHTAVDRHTNVFSHTWRVKNSYLGKAAWLETATRDDPQQDIGQICRQQGKSLCQDDPTLDQATCQMAVLDCECELTNQQPALDAKFVRDMGLGNTCLYDGCQVSPCALYQSLVHGRPDDDDGNSTDSGSQNSGSEDSGSGSQNSGSQNQNSQIESNAHAQHLIARLSHRAQKK